MKNAQLNPFKVFIISLLAVFFASNIALAKDDKKDGEVNLTEMIMHHLQDTHEWHLFTTGEGTPEEHHVSIPLPVIIYTSEHGLDVFMSSNFPHETEDFQGHQVRAYDRYVMYHEHIYLREGLRFEGEHPHGTAVMDFSITKNTASMFISAFLLILVFMAVAKGYKKNEGKAPKGIQSFFEPMITYMIDDVIKPNIGEKKYLKYTPYILTLFFFIWFNNMLGLVPTGANLTGNIAFTLTLAVFTMIVTNVSGNGHYWRHIFAMPGVPIFVLPIITIVEILGILIKPFALMIRLFANITAGHSIILALTGLTFLAGTALAGVPVSLFVLPMMLLEVFVALLQAYIFALLSALFIGQAVEDGHH